MSFSFFLYKSIARRKIETLFRGLKDYFELPSWNEKSKYRSRWRSREFSIVQCISTCQTILLFLYVYLSLKKIWNTRKIILLTLENIIPRLKRSHETVFQDSSFPRYGGADSWFNFLIRGKNRFSSAIRLSSTPFAIPRAPTLGMQPSFFFFSLGFHYSIYSPEPPITFVNGLSRREEFIASYLRFPACVPFESCSSPRVSLTRTRPICCFVSRDMGKEVKKKIQKKKKRRKIRVKNKI